MLVVCGIVNRHIFEFNKVLIFGFRWKGYDDRNKDVGLFAFCVRIYYMCLIWEEFNILQYDTVYYLNILIYKNI